MFLTSSKIFLLIFLFPHRQQHCFIQDNLRYSICFSNMWLCCLSWWTICDHYTLPVNWISPPCSAKDLFLIFLQTLFYIFLEGNLNNEIKICINLLFNKFYHYYIFLYLVCYVAISLPRINGLIIFSNIYLRSTRNTFSRTILIWLCTLFILYCCLLYNVHIIRKETAQFKLLGTLRYVDIG